MLENVEKLEHLCIAGENLHDTAAVENSAAVSQKN